MLKSRIKMFKVNLIIFISIVICTSDVQCEDVKLSSIPPLAEITSQSSVIASLETSSLPSKVVNEETSTAPYEISSATTSSSLPLVARIDLDSLISTTDDANETSSTANLTRTERSPQYYPGDFGGFNGGFGNYNGFQGGFGGGGNYDGFGRGGRRRGGGRRRWREAQAYAQQGYNAYPQQGYNAYPQQGYNGYPQQGYNGYPQQPNYNDFHRRNGYHNNFGVAGVGCEVPKAGDQKNRRRNGGRRRKGNGRWRDGGRFANGGWEEYVDRQKRKSEIKLDEYWRRVYECGTGDENEPLTQMDLNGRLVAAPGEYRHMAVIGLRGADRKKEWKCGGSLIDFNFVLTAAHCTHFGGQQPTHVKIGDINLKVREDTVATQRMRIAHIYRHPQYRKNSYYHDIALLELARPAVWTRHVRPVRLWPYADFPISTLYALGYGATQFGRTPIDVLTFLNLTMVNNQQCSTALPPNPDAKQGIIDSQLCALDLDGKADTCQGDSGGPLQLHLPGRRKTKYYLVGITSYGLACGSRAPSVYTRIYSYLDWIESIVFANVNNDY